MNNLIIAIGILTLCISCQNKSMTNSTLECQAHSSCSINHSFFSPLQSMFSQSTSVLDELQYFLDMLIHNLNIILRFKLFEKENINVKAQDQFYECIISYVNKVYKEKFNNYVYCCWIQQFEYVSQFENSVNKVRCHIF